MIQTLNSIRENKIIVIARKVPEYQICDLAQALLNGGLSCLEVTFDHSCPEGTGATLHCIRLLSDAFGSRMTIGAGTVLTGDEVRMAADAGAKYIISPDTCESVIRETKKLDLVSIPGAMTPTEIRAAHDMGADIVKLFPANILGPDFVKAMQGPFPHIPLLMAGGVTPENIGAYLKVGAVGAGCLGKLVNRQWMDDGQFDKITETARRYVCAVRDASV